MSRDHPEGATSLVAESDQSPLNRPGFRRFGGLVAPYGKDVAVVAAGLLVETSFNSLLPFSFKFIVDQGLVGGNHVLLGQIIIGLALGAVAASAIGLGRDYLYARLS